MRKAKIVATLGPASSDEKVIFKLALAGVNIFRLNFSHGDYATHRAIFNKVKKAEKRIGHPLGIMQDLQGIKVRVRGVKNGKMEVKNGDIVTLGLNYNQITRKLKVGYRLSVDDGKIELKVVGKDKDKVKVKVTRGGELKEGKGVQIPELKIDMPGVTAKDRKDLKFGVQLGVDFVAQSFVRTAKDVSTVKKIVPRHVLVFAKIENEEGIDNIDSIIAAADGIMVARGDMGVCIDRAQVPFVQKMIIDKCNAVGKPVITATDMLDSMIRNPNPTRAEVTDVTEAIIQGTDCVMLSGETAEGKYPVAAVTEMAHIAAVAEDSLDYDQYLVSHHVSPGHSVPEAMGYSARELADLVGAKLIMTFTKSGRTAEIISRFRPAATILAFTPVKTTQRKLLVYWGILTYLYPERQILENAFDANIRFAVKKGLLKKGEWVVIIGGGRTRLEGPTNFIKVLRA